MRTLIVITKAENCDREGSNGGRVGLATSWFVVVQGCAIMLPHSLGVFLLVCGVAGLCFCVWKVVVFCHFVIVIYRRICCRLFGGLRVGRFKDLVMVWCWLYRGLVSALGILVLINCFCCSCVELVLFRCSFSQHILGCSINKILFWFFKKKNYIGMHKKTHHNRDNQIQWSERQIW